MIIVLYLSAIVAANLLVAKFGPSIAIINTFVFIGLDLTARDTLHERWQHKNLWLKMAILIATGSALSAALSWQARNIAIASCVAFALAGLVDALMYQSLKGRAHLVKVNGSNVVSAAVDSIVFPALAFGFPLLLGVMLASFVGKVAGGFVWSIVLKQPVKQIKGGGDMRANHVGPNF